MKERYAIIEQSTNKVLTHVEASWVGEALEFGKELFPENNVIPQLVSGEEEVDVESTGASSLAGVQLPIQGKNEEKLREAIQSVMHEVIRKKEGGGGYVLYSPNKGKKKPSKAVGEFPTRIAARRAELARFPPQDAERLKKLRKDIDKLTKDPKKRIEREKQDVSGKKRPKQSGAPKRAAKRKPKKESLNLGIAQFLSEALFAEEGEAISQWDDRLSSMSKSAVEADRRLQSLQKTIEKKSISTLEAAVKQLGRAVKQIKGRVSSEGPKKDEQRQKTYVAAKITVDGIDIGPIYLFVEDGRAKIEISGEARNGLTRIDPKKSKQLRAELVSFQEDILDAMDDVVAAIEARDSYLSKVESGVDELVSGMDALELTMLKSLLTTKYRGGRAK